MTNRIGTGDCTIFRDTSVNRAWTSGIGDCVALAIRGKTKNGEVDTCFTHLHSQQYMMPAFGGHPDNHFPAVRKVKKFIKNHKQDLECLAATNYDHTVPVRANINVRYGLNLKELKHLRAGGNNGVVTLDIDRFEMYASVPEKVSENKSINNCPSMASLRRTDKAGALSRLYQSIVSTFRFSNKA